MLNFYFLEKDLGIIFPPHFVYNFSRKMFLMYIILGDSQNYMTPILVPSSAKRIATQIVVIAKLNGRKDFILTGFNCDIIHTSKELPVQS